MSSAKEVNDLMERGAWNWYVGATNMNLESSRSHSVLTAQIESKTMNGGLWNVKVS